MRWPFGKTYEVRCPDGVKTVYRNIDDALPLALKSSQTNVTARLDAVAGASGTIGGDYKQKVEGLLVGLDRKSNALMTKYRAAYLVFKSDPCGRSGYLAEAFTRMSDEHDRLALLELGIEGLIEIARAHPKDPTFFMTEFRSLAKQFASFSPEIGREAAVAEIVEARADAAEWIATANDPSSERDS